MIPCVPQSLRDTRGPGTRGPAHLFQEGLVVAEVGLAAGVAVLDDDPELHIYSYLIRREVSRRRTPAIARLVGCDVSALPAAKPAPRNPSREAVLSRLDPCKRKCEPVPTLQQALRAQVYRLYARFHTLHLCSARRFGDSPSPSESRPMADRYIFPISAEGLGWCWASRRWMSPPRARQ